MVIHVCDEAKNCKFSSLVIVIIIIIHRFVYLIWCLSNCTILFFLLFFYFAWCFYHLFLMSEDCQRSLESWFARLLPAYRFVMSNGVGLWNAKLMMIRSIVIQRWREDIPGRLDVMVARTIWKILTCLDRMHSLETTGEGKCMGQLANITLFSNSNDSDL